MISIAYPKTNLSIPKEVMLAKRKMKNLKINAQKI